MEEQRIQLETIYILLPENLRQTEHIWWKMTDQMNLVVGDVLTMTNGHEPVAVEGLIKAFQVRSIEPLTMDPIVVTEEGKLTNYQIVDKGQTCEGCRSLKYTGIPKWTCKKKHGTSGAKYIAGYPVRGCTDDYRPQ